MTAEPLALTLAAAAECLSVSPRTVRRLMDAGQLRRVSIGRSVRVSAASVRAFVELAEAQALAALDKSAPRAILPARTDQDAPITTASTSAPARHSGGLPGPTAQATALGALLGLLTAATPRPSLPAGASKRTAPRTPRGSRSEPSTR